MNYDVSLTAVGLVVGLLLIGAHAMALVKPRESRQWLAEFPRSPIAGFVLLTLAALWTFYLLWIIDMGEFGHLQRPAMVLLPIAYLLVWRLLDEFLAVRALGILLVLAGAPMLDSAFMQPQNSRLLVTVLAYVWLTLGLFLVGMPYLLRDLIAWVSKNSLRWKTGAVAGLIYGVALLLLSLTLYRSP